MKNLISIINDLYNLKLHSAEKVTKGFLSENHTLYGDDKKYFLKRYRFDKRERIEEIHSAKKYFGNGGIPVVLPIINSAGETFFFYDNRYYALFPFVTDAQVEKELLEDAQIISLGQMLGKIHLLGKECTLPIKERFKSWDKKKALEKIDDIEVELMKINNPTDFDILAKKSIENKRKLILNNSVTFADLHLPNDHLIHGDYLVHNVFFGSDDKVSFVFDFEKTDYSPRMFELFRSLMLTFMSGNMIQKEIEKARLYLKSYLSIYPANKDELTRGLRLYYLKTIHGTWVEDEHYINKSSRVDQFLSDDFKRIQYLSGCGGEFGDFDKIC